MYPIGAVSRGQKGAELADIAELKESGCVAVTDDGHPVATAMLMRRALEYTGMFNMPVIEHCEEQTLKADGVAHEGFHASALGYDAWAKHLVPYVLNLPDTENGRVLP